MKDRRQQWIDMMNEGKFPKLDPMTQSQSKFADFLFEHEHMLGQVGNLQEVFNSVYKFIKKVDPEIRKAQ